MSCKCSKGQGTRKQTCLTCQEEMESYGQEGSQQTGREVTNGRLKRDHSQWATGQEPPDSWQVQFPRSSVVVRNKQPKKSLVVKGRQKAGGTLGEREGSVDYTRLCVVDCVRPGQVNTREERRDGARLWVKLLRRAPECSSGKGQGQGQPQDLWLGEQRWGAWRPVYSHMGEGWRHLIALFIRHRVILTALSH